MKRTVFCTLALLTPAAANSTPTRLDGVGGSALEVDENCPVTVTAEQLTFQIQRDNDYGRLCAQVTAVYQMENPTEEPLTVPMAFYLEERKGQVGSGLEPSQVSVTADGQALSFTQREVEFTLYREPSITLWDRCNAFLQDAGYVMFFLGPVILVVAVLVIIWVLLRWQRR